MPGAKTKRDECLDQWTLKFSTGLACQLPDHGRRASEIVFFLQELQEPVLGLKRSSMSFRDLLTSGVQPEGGCQRRSCHDREY